MLYRKNNYFKGGSNVLNTELPLLSTRYKQEC